MSALRGTLARLAQEAALWPWLALRRGAPGPRVAFLPGDGRVQSALLRVYNIAADLAARGWSALVLPARLSLAQRRRLLRAFSPALVVVQQCRHPLNRVEHLRGWALVLDIDDADWFDPKLAPALEEMARSARGVICGSRFVRDWARGLNPNSVVVWTGTPVTAAPAPPQAARRPIVTWAQAHPLGYPEEFAFVCRVMRDVARRRGGVDFRLYGWDGAPDHPDLEDLRAAGVRVETRPYMAYDAFLASLREVAVGLSAIESADFGRGKSFGKILGYLDAGVPAICSDAADHARFFTPATGVVSNDPAVWAEAIAALLGDPARRQAMADAAHGDFVRQLSTAAAGRRVHDFLGRLIPDRITGPPVPA